MCASFPVNRELSLAWCRALAPELVPSLCPLALDGILSSSVHAMASRRRMLPDVAVRHAPRTCSGGQLGSLTEISWGSV